MPRLEAAPQNRSSAVVDCGIFGSPRHGATRRGNVLTSATSANERGKIVTLANQRTSFAYATNHPLLTGREWRCRSSSKRRAIPRGHHEMYEGIRKCEPFFLWAVTAPSHPSFGADPSHQCSNRPNGQMVPRLAVWTVGAIGGDALRLCLNGASTCT